MGDIRFAYVRNRSEENRKDIWNEFVIPRYFDTLEIRRQRKAVVIEGGRGCGKTTLLRYLSHASQFSPNRDNLSQKDLDFIGIYWKLDVNYLNAFQSGDLPENMWISAFKHHLACCLSLEILGSIESINCSAERVRKFGGIESIDFSELASFDGNLPSNVRDLTKALRARRDALATWLNNIGNVPQPLFLPGEKFLQRLVELLKGQLSYLRDAIFSVFIDEYENLPDYQQKYVNGLMKCAEAPLLFSVAMKPNGMRTRQTLTQESIQNTSDYRHIDLEEASREEFGKFAAEILFFRLVETRPDLTSRVPITPRILTDESRLDERKNEAYQDDLMQAARSMLPRKTESQLAKEIVRNSLLRDRLERQIKQALEAWGSKLNPSDFIRPDLEEAAVVCSALLSRRRQRPELVLKALKDFERDRAGPFVNWIGTNLFGVELQLYSPLETACPLYSGFDALVLMARSNVRYFLELIHQIFRDNVEQGVSDIPIIEPEKQASSIQLASRTMVEEIAACGPYSTQLHTFTKTIGSLFAEKQKQLAQSEPEINQFTLASGDLPEDLHEYLAEAEKWSVVLVSRETKMKNAGAVAYDYLLHPAFSASFGISYRKKRSIGLGPRDLAIFFNGSQGNRDATVKTLAKNSDSDSGDLFSAGEQE